MRGHVRRRGNTWSYVIDLGRDEDDKRRQKWVGGFRTKADANQALTKALHDVQVGSFVVPQRTTLRQFVKDEWLPSTRPLVRSTTWASYEANLRLHVLPRLGDKRLQHVRATDLNKLYADLLETGRVNGQGGLSARSVRYVHTLIGRVLGDACKWGYLAVNPAKLATPPTAKTAAQSTWTADEVRAFLTSVNEDDLYPAFVLAATTGMRRGEVLGLRWRDVDLDAARLSVQQALIATGYNLSFEEPKTERSRRSIALDAATVSTLRALKVRQAQERLRFGPDYQATDLVFTQADGSPVHPMTLSDTFKRRVKSAALPPIRFHDLRHTWATLAFSQGMHPKVVSDRLGHSSITVTLDIYSHAVPALQEEAAATVAALFLDSAG